MATISNFEFETIPNNVLHPMHIKLDKIKPFVNTCVVTGGCENVNIEVEYIPGDKLLEVVNFRENFNREFNESMEKMCEKVFDAFMRDVEPRWLKVTIFLDEVRLTPWHVTICSDDL